MCLLSKKRGQKSSLFASLLHNKKAQTEALHEALKTLLGAVMFLLLLSFATDIYLIWTYTATTPEEKDLRRISAELLTLQEGESFDVITSGENYAMHLYQKGEQNYPECRKTACLCYSKVSTMQKCREIELSQNCEQGACIKKTGQNTHQIQKGESITICRKNNEILLEQCAA